MGNGIVVGFVRMELMTVEFMKRGDVVGLLLLNEEADVLVNEKPVEFVIGKGSVVTDPVDVIPVTVNVALPIFVCEEGDFVLEKDVAALLEGDVTAFVPVRDVGFDVSLVLVFVLVVFGLVFVILVLLTNVQDEILLPVGVGLVVPGALVILVEFLDVSDEALVVALDETDDLFVVALE